MEGDSAAVLDELFKSSAGSRGLTEGLQGTMFSRGAEQCSELALQAVRCADLQGFRHPSCLRRKLRHQRCLSSFVAPEFLQRLENCEMRQDKSGNGAKKSTACGKFEEDLDRVVTQRFDTHINRIRYTDAERRAIVRCGAPFASSSPGERVSRLRCMLPVVCEQHVDVFRKCLEAGGAADGVCAARAAEAMECLGLSVAKLYFKDP